MKYQTNFEKKNTLTIFNRIWGKLPFELYVLFQNPDGYILKISRDKLGDAFAQDIFFYIYLFIE